jgi:hypothetical protein
MFINCITLVPTLHHIEKRAGRPIPENPSEHRKTVVLANHLGVEPKSKGYPMSGDWPVGKSKQPRDFKPIPRLRTGDGRMGL